MPPKVLSLGTVTIEDSSEPLILEAKATAQLRVEDNLSQLTSEFTKERLESGDLWVSRGVGFCLDIEILFNGIPIGRTGFPHLLESMGYWICEAKYWSSLHLSAVLEVPVESSTSHFLIKIAEDITPTVSLSREPRYSPCQSVGLIPPPNIPCAKLEKIYLQCNFLLAKEGSKPTRKPKRKKTETLQPSPLNVMLLDGGSDSAMDTSLTQLELDIAVQSLERLRGSLGEIFNSDKTTKAGTYAHDQLVAGSRGQWHPKYVPDILKDWLSSNIEKPYADDFEQLKLIKRTGLRKEQVQRSLYYWRKKILKDLQKKDSEMLLGLGIDPIPQIQRMRRKSSLHLGSSPNEKEMLLLQGTTESEGSDDFVMLLDTNTSSSLNESSEVIPSTSIGIQAFLSIESSAPVRSFSIPLKRPSTENVSAGLKEETVVLSDGIITSHLVDTALRRLVGGCFHGHRSKPGLEMNKGFEIPLQSLAPSLFNLNFGKAMARNSRFLPIITRSISTSLQCRAQSPALRRKLSTLTQMAVASSPSVNDATLAKSQLLSSIVQSRLWAMMQRRLFEPSSATKLLRTDYNSDRWIEKEDFEDLLDDEKTSGSVGPEEVLMDDFDDLLEGEQRGNEFLDHIEKAERERLDIERETEEMLFGCCEEVGQDLFLFGDEGDEDSLLL